MMSLRKQSSMWAVVVVATLAAGTACGGGMWGLAADWDASGSPNGSWAYTRATDGSHLSSSNEPWGGTPGYEGGLGWGTPWVFVSPGGSAGFGALAGEYISSGGTSYEWTSPIANTVEVSGIITEVKGWGTGAYKIMKNGNEVASGASSPPAARANFSHLVEVAVGDVLAFQNTNAGVGTVEITEIPEPSTIGLLGLGSLAFLGRRRR
jgi:hypothetical protein